MPAGMNIEHPIVDDFCAVAIELVGECLDRAFVAGNDRGRKNYCVAWLNAEYPMALINNSHEDGIVLPLRSGGKDNNLGGRVVFHFLDRSRRRQGRQPISSAKRMHVLCSSYGPAGVNVRMKSTPAEEGYLVGSTTYRVRPS